jgi:mRNA-degrading endonuclease RelE of RelBE toxin-antitoxin system
MTRALSVEKRFQEELLALPRDAARKIVRAIDELRSDPHHLSKQLENADGVWRREVQPYRVLFTLGPGWVHVYSVQHRQGVYGGGIARAKEEPETPRPPFRTLPSSANTATTVTTITGTQAAGWDNARLVLDCNSPNALEDLIPKGIPVDLYDRLLTALNNSRRQAEDSAVRLQLIRSDVIDAFFSPVLASRSDMPPSELLIVSPWLTPWKSPRSSLETFTRYVAKGRIRTTLITRPPDSQSHRQAVAALAKLPSVAISYVKDLHAKYFVCDGAPLAYALVASANMTARSFTNLEVGVFLRGTGKIEALIKDFQGLATELLAVGKRIKKWEVS